MLTVIQFFLDKNCIQKETIFKWDPFYNNIYYDKGKDFAQSFIQQLISLT